MVSLNNILLRPPGGKEEAVSSNLHTSHALLLLLYHL